MKSGKDNDRTGMHLARPGGVHGWRSKDGSLAEPKVDSQSTYPVGKTKPPGSNYTKCLVVPKIEGEDTDWIGTELDDLIQSGLLTTAVYQADNPYAKLHLPKNKGHEAMTYLTYIIDFYDKLADVNIFMHSHRFAWHNNEILESDASLTVRHLSPERVTREGYMNLRCHWDPGCPDWLLPGSKLQNIEKPEEYLLAQKWTELFPGTAGAPPSLAQPCCAQFAVSRARLRAIPRNSFVHLRDWLLNTDLSDYLTGRMFEYTWQYIFSGAPVHCPSMRACYCDGYGLCFGDYPSFNQYFTLSHQRGSRVAELNVWMEKADAIEAARRHRADGLMGWEEGSLETPAPGRDEVLRKEIADLDAQLLERRKQAFERGRDARQRAFESGREWKEGDGY